MGEKKFVTPQEAAKIFGRSLDGIYLAIKRKEIPAVKLGKRFYIPSRFMQDGKEIVLK